MSTHLFNSQTARDGFIAMEQLSMEENGEPVGELIALGKAYLFYTTNPNLSALDGQRFSSVSEARKAIRARLREARVPRLIAG
jgi:hypothetical protein